MLSSKSSCRLMPRRFGTLRKTRSNCWTKGGTPTHFIYAIHAKNPTLVEPLSVLIRTKENCQRTTDFVLLAHPTHKQSADTQTNIDYFTFGNVAIVAPLQTLFARVQFTFVMTVTIETANESENISDQVLLPPRLRWNQSHVKVVRASTPKHQAVKATRIIIIMTMDPRRRVNNFIIVSCAFHLLSESFKRIQDRETLFTIPMASRAFGGGVSLPGHGKCKLQKSHSMTL